MSPFAAWYHLFNRNLLIEHKPSIFGAHEALLAGLGLVKTHHVELAHIELDQVVAPVPAGCCRAAVELLEIIDPHPARGAAHASTGQALQCNQRIVRPLIAALAHAIGIGARALQDVFDRGAHLDLGGLSLRRGRRRAPGGGGHGRGREAVAEQGPGQTERKHSGKMGHREVPRGVR